MHGSIQAANGPGKAPEFRHLKLGDPIVFASDSCLIVRRPGMTCGLCREACPANVLTGGQSSVAIESDGCVGCGLCAAACPTGALVVEGFIPDLAQRTGDRIVLECRRVADSDRDRDAVVVPCLGGLTTPDLVNLAEKTDAAVIAVDHGWCAACPIARCDAPWQGAFDEAKSILSAVEARLADRLAVESRRLPPDRATPVLPALRPDKKIGRRDFLQSLVGSAEPRDALAESRRVVFGRGLVAPIKRERILEQVRALAADIDQDIPATLMPAIKIADGCEINGLCAAICPTGALTRGENDNAVSLRFDAARCIACGECQRVCPSKALKLWQEGDGTVPQGATTLVRRQTVSCASCGGDFVPKGDECFCPLCQKSMDVMQEIASLKFGSAGSSR